MHYVYNYICTYIQEFLESNFFVFMDFGSMDIDYILSIFYDMVFLMGIDHSFCFLEAEVFRRILALHVDGEIYEVYCISMSMNEGNWGEIAANFCCELYICWS